MYKQNYISPRYIIAGLCVILVIIILYMTFTAQPKAIEGFSFVDKPEPTKLGERKRENFLAGEIKGFAFNSPVKERMTNTKLSKLRHSTYRKNNANSTTKNNSKNDKHNNKSNNKQKSKLNKLAKRGQVDEFQDVLNEVDSMDVSSISVKGISDTIRRYNDNIENRLKYAKAKNNSSDMESAMSQFDVLKDEFVKIFAFSDYL